MWKLGEPDAQVVDFQWHPTDPYTMVSVSDAGSGGTLQVWRISDLIWRPIDEVLKDLEEHRCASPPLVSSLSLVRSRAPSAAACLVNCVWWLPPL